MLAGHAVPTDAMLWLFAEINNTIENSYRQCIAGVTTPTTKIKDEVLSNN